MTYSRLAPCTVETIDGVTTFIDPSWYWPARKQPSQPHVRAHETRRRKQRERDPVA